MVQVDDAVAEAVLVDQVDLEEHVVGERARSASGDDGVEGQVHPVDGRGG